MFVAIPVVAVAGTAIYQRYNAQPTPDTEEGEEEEEQENEETSEGAENKGTVVPAGQDPADKLASQWKASSSQDTWKASAKREEGPDSYVFGDITRGIYSRLTAGFASSDPAQAAVIEADAEEKATQVQRLVRDAVILFRARGYEGSISMTHTVGYFTESARVSVTAPKEAPEPSRWLWKTPPKPTMKPGDGTRAGRVFETLLNRLERRAQKWAAAEEALEGMEDLDPDLAASAQIGFAMPVIKLGWGVGVSLSIKQSTLLRFAKVAAADAEDEEPARIA